MPSEVEVCNLALSHISKSPIASLTERSREATECKLLYPHARDAALRDHQWNFSRKEQTLALLDETASGWLYVYQWPSDCLLAREVYNPLGKNTDKVPFDIGINSTRSSRVILTDQEDAVLIYSAKVTDPNAFDSVFIDAMSWRLAADLAMPLRGDPKMYQQMMQVYLSFISRAKAVNANEQVTDVDDSNTFVDARA